MQRLAFLVLLGTCGASRVARANDSTHQVHAYDSTHLVCAGIAVPTDGANEVGVSISYEERRAGDGTNRNVTVRELVGDVVFKATRNGDADANKIYSLVLKAGKQVRFTGTYTLSVKSGAFWLHLVGKIAAADKKQHPFDSLLPCIDISTT